MATLNPWQYLMANPFIPPQVSTGMATGQPQQQSQFAHPGLHGDQSQFPWPMFGAQQATPTDWRAIGNIVHPPDVQGEANKAYVPGVDNGSNPFSNGFFGGQAGHIAAEEKAWGPGNSITQNGVNPAAQAQTQSAMMAAFAPQAAQVQHQLPWTQYATAPVGQNPGMGNNPNGQVSPAYMDYYQHIQRQLQNPFAMLR